MLRDRLGIITKPNVDPELNELTEAVIGAAIEVHRALGPGLPEVLYKRAMCVEMRLRGIEYEVEAAVPVAYKGQSIGEMRLDLLVGKRLIVELKSVDALLPIHKAQLITYLRVTGKELGLLINFNLRTLKEGIRRIALTLDT